MHGTGSAPALTPQLLLAAYAQGIFPMGDSDAEGALAWYDPDPRALFPLGAIRPNARLLRYVRSHGLRCTTDAAFGPVMRLCGIAHGESWITGEMVLAYTGLHRMGHAHSVETWAGDELVGGIYGVSLGAAFFGESMFSLVPNASKAAFHHLAEHLRQRGYTLFDSQYINHHTASLGAVEVPRNVFKAMLKEAVAVPVEF